MMLTTCTQLLWLTMARPGLSGTCPVKPLYGLGQCWGKLHLKVIHYNIVLIPKKVTNYVTWLLSMESNALHYFCVTF